MGQLENGLRVVSNIAEALIPIAVFIDTMTDNSSKQRIVHRQRKVLLVKEFTLGLTYSEKERLKQL